MTEKIPLEGFDNVGPRLRYSAIIKTDKKGNTIGKGIIALAASFLPAYYTDGHVESLGGVTWLVIRNVKDKDGKLQDEDDHFKTYLDSEYGEALELYEALRIVAKAQEFETSYELEFDELNQAHLCKYVSDGAESNQKGTTKTQDDDDV